MSINMHLIVSIFSFSNRNENCVMLGMSSQLKRKAEKSESQKVTRDTTEQQLISLQQQTLVAVNSLVDVQRQMLELKRARLEVEREKLMIRKLQLVSKGWIQNEEGQWVGIVNTVENGEE